MFFLYPIDRFYLSVVKSILVLTLPYRKQSILPSKLIGDLNIHVFQICGFQFIGQSEPFAVMNVVQGFAILIMQMIQGYFLDETDPYQLKIYTLIIGSFGIISSIVTYFFPYKTKFIIDNRSSYLKVNMTETNDSTTRFSG